MGALAPWRPARIDAVRAFLGGLLAWALYLLVRLPGRARALRIAESPRFGRLLAASVNFLLRKRNHCFARNLQLVFPGIDDAGIRSLETQVWCNNAKTLVETSYLSAKEFPRITVTGREHLEAAGGGGIIFVTAHLHTMYYVPLLNRMLGYETAFLHRAMDGFLQQALNRRLLGHIGTAVPANEARRFVQHLRDGGNVAITPDLRVKGGRHASHLLLCGHPAWTSTFVAGLALEYGRPIVPTYVLRHADNRIEQVFEPAIDLSSGDRDTVQQLVNDSIGARILAHPGAWSLWNTNRWGP